MHWRVVLDRRTGAVRSVQLQEASFTPEGDYVFYVEAERKKDAVIGAKAQWEERRRKQNEYRQAEREARRQNNQCKNCIRQLTIEDLECGHAQCDTCRGESRERAQERVQLKKKLGLGAKDPLPPEYRRKKSAGPSGFGSQSRMRRFRILVEVHEELRRRTKAEGMRWLDNEIAMCAPEPQTSVATGTRPRLRVVR